MSEIPLRVKTIISTYLNALQNNHIPVNQIILFGSYAKGNRKEWSDIDIALVSDIFEGKRLILIEIVTVESFYYSQWQ